MSGMYEILLMCVGGLFVIAYQNLSQVVSRFRCTRTCSNIYEKVYQCIISDRAIFKSRVNDCVEISVDLPSLGQFQFFYYLSKNDFGLFRNKEIVYSTYYCKSELVSRITSLILKKYNKNINDVVRMGDHLIDVNTYNSIINNYSNHYVTQGVSSLNKSYDLDSILDRISEVGYENLTDGEKEFLNNLK